MQDLTLIKQIIDDRCITIHERNYNLTPTTHERRVKVLAFFTKIQKQLTDGDFTFLVDKDYKEVEKILTDCTLFENGILTKEVNHWEKFPEDFLIYVTNMLVVISYPFLQGKTMNLPKE